MARRIHLLFAAVLAPSFAALAGCAGEESEPTQTSDVTAAPFTEGSRPARAAVAFTNDPATVVTTLRTAGVGTNSTANAIVARRNGADGDAGTSDDAPFRLLGDLDAVKGVGPVTLERLAAYGLARGYGNERGIHHGVYFGEAQADRTLDLVNTVSASELDADTSVDRRALATIEAARPIVSLAQLGSLSRVKGSALRLLREHADRTLGPTLCEDDAACASGERCIGRSEYRPGTCVDDDVEGDGEPCASDGACGPGLVCAGRSDDFEGICNPSWMRGEFVNEGTGSIPDGPDGSVGLGVEVHGLASVPTDAIVRVVIDHDRPEDLELTLSNVYETTSVVWPAGRGAIPQAPEGIVVGVPGDENANGPWVLTVRDTRAGVQGTVSLFALEMISRWD